MGARYPVPDKWEPFQDRFSDSAAEVRPTFLTCTNAPMHDYLNGEWWINPLVSIGRENPLGP